MKWSRIFAMPSGDTFSIRPVSCLLDRWLDGAACVVDPFARNSARGTLTNDLDSATKAQHHMQATEFLAQTCKGVTADAVLFDPPYSPRQISQLYRGMGLKCSRDETQNARLYREVKLGLKTLLKPGGIAISCGWNSTGFGFELMEIMLVSHGSAHNDTIVMVERKAGGFKIAPALPEPVV